MWFFLLASALPENAPNDQSNESDDENDASSKGVWINHDNIWMIITTIPQCCI